MSNLKEKVVPEEEIKLTLEYKGKKYTRKWNFTDLSIRMSGRMIYIAGAKDAAAGLMHEALSDRRVISDSFFGKLTALNSDAFELKSVLSLGQYHVRYAKDAYQGFGFGSYHRFPMSGRSFHIQIGRHSFFLRKEYR